MLSVKYSGRVLFSVQKLTQRVKIARLRSLYRAASYIRTAARRSLRIRAGASTPPGPPHAHTRSGLREIAFVVDERASAALIGPVKFPGSRYFDEPVPHIHEFGGVFISRRSISKYPQRSYMYFTLKKLVLSGKLPKEFVYNMARVL